MSKAAMETLSFSLSFFFVLRFAAEKGGEGKDGDVKLPRLCFFFSSSIFRGSHANIAENVRPRE